MLKTIRYYSFLIKINLSLIYSFTLWSSALNVKRFMLLPKCQPYPEANLMIAEQTFAWMGKYQKSCEKKSRNYFLQDDSRRFLIQWAKQIFILSSTEWLSVEIDTLNIVIQVESIHCCHQPSCAKSPTKAQIKQAHIIV